MNKHFNIKKISMLIFSLVCFLILGNKVEAKYVCFYQDSLIYGQVDTVYDKDTKEEIKDVKRIYVRLTYEDNGDKNLIFYDDLSKKTYNTLVSTNGTTEEEFKISSRSLKQLTKDDFSKNGCPAIKRIYSWPGASGIIYDAFKKGTDEYKQFEEVQLKDSVFKNLGWAQGNTSYCKDYSEYCSELSSINLDITEDERVANGEITNCSYSDVGYYVNTKDISVSFVLTLYHKTKKVSGYTTDDNNLAYIAFSYEDVGGKCPNKFYMDTRDANSVYLNKHEVPDDGNPVLYGLIHHLNYDEIEEGAGKTGCALIGDTTMSYIRKAYDLLRFIVPIIIIVFSIIDFAGVVISGEDDKMAKAKSKFIKRMIIGVVILFIPIILEILLQLVGILDKNERLVDIACLK